jgi:S-DNA-T family DNA segregation ATPase FtsK/SpoIIIE
LRSTHCIPTGAPISIVIGFPSQPTTGRTVTPTPHTSSDRPHLVVIDELAFYLTLPDKAQRQEFAELNRDLVARGRAAGVIVCAATQKPGADVVPSALRDLFGFRFALRCTTPQASDTILGQGWASNDADASTIPSAQRDVGYLLGEGERPVKIRGYYLDDDAIAAIASRAASRRADDWLGDEVAS